MGSEIALSIIVSTIGRPDDLRRLIDSLVAQDAPGTFELIVVDQSDDGNCVALLADLDLPFPCRSTTSGRGVSLGRNVGASLATGWLYAVPDDNCWYAPDTVSSVLRRMSPDRGPDALSGIQITDDGQPSMLRWPAERAPITLRNVSQAAISSTIFMKAELFDRLNGFDETLGVGSAGPFQAGEDTDILLRALEGGARVIYDPGVKVLQDDPRQEVTPGFKQKMLGYGMGEGRLFRIHQLPRTRLAYLLGRKGAAAAVRASRGRSDLAAADLAWARGLVAGYRSKVPY